MHLTPDILRATYDFLKATPPFRRWSLPHSDKVTFKVINNPNDAWGRCAQVGKHLTFTVNMAKISHVEPLVSTMAHEMVHLYCFLKNIDNGHGAAFHKRAALVCKHHGFDPKGF